MPTINLFERWEEGAELPRSVELATTISLPVLLSLAPGTMVLRLYP